MENFNIASFVFYALLTWLILRIIQGYLERKNQELQADIDLIKNKIKSQIMIVNIEKHGDCYYLFDKETDTFVAQGKTVEEIKDAMQKRYPGKTFMANEKHLEELGLKF